MLRMITRRQPISHPRYRLVEKRKSRLRDVQAARPAANSGGVGQAIGGFKLRHCLFPRTMLHYPPKQCLAPRQQTVMRVRERKHRQEGERPTAPDAAAPANPNPVVMLVMRLFAAPSVTDNRIAVTSRTMA